MDKPQKSVAEKDMIELLATLIDQYDELHSTTPDFSPGEMLRFFLERRKLSKTELARQTGIPQSTIPNVISGRRQLSKTGVSTLSKFFEMSPAIFME
jgi:HTH-type transcriptional regulator/antitoxin HigA